MGGGRAGTSLPTCLEDAAAESEHRRWGRTRRAGPRVPKSTGGRGGVWAFHRGMDSGPSRLVGGIREVLSRQRVQGRCRQNPRLRDSEDAPVSPPAWTGAQLWGKKPFSLLP